MPTRERIAKNERLFREVNERIREIGERLADRLAPLDFFCECADFDCTAHVTLELAAYEAVRRDPVRFVAVPGHELADVEHVVERHESYVVIAKPWLAGRDG